MYVLCRCKILLIYTVSWIINDSMSGVALLKRPPNRLTVNRTDDLSPGQPLANQQLNRKKVS